jgi:uncharacterized protein YlzI (FlbEa/FlbD family)
VIKLTDINDRPVLVSVDQVQSVEDYPAGQTMLTLSNGSILQVKESVETVQSLIEKEKPS